MIWRYMINWGHPFGMGGITYIAVGQHVKMLNPRRVESIEYDTKRDLRKEFNLINDIWEAKKARWQRAADNSPTLYQYLKDTFYGEDEELD
jgi:hypothetical protein